MRNPLRHAPNVTRVLALGLIVGNVVLAVAVKAAADSTTQNLRAFGRSVLRYSDGRTMNDVRTITLNGAEVRMATGSTRDTVRQVMDFYAARCREIDGGLSAQVREHSPFRHELRRHLPADFNDFMDVNEAATMVRFVTDTEGFIICFDVGRERVDLNQFVTRVIDAMQHGDLTGASDFRYVYAQRPAGDSTTSVVGFWTERSNLNITRMFPTEGDAPGRAVPGLPRPVGMRRVLNAYESGTPLSYTTFVGTTAIAQLESQLRRDMVSQGWQFFPLRRSPLRAGEHFLAFERGRESVMFYLSRDGESTWVVQFAEEATPIR
jgi:hypothetical protein